MIFDSHTHIQFPVYDADRDNVIKRAQSAGIHPHTKRALTSEETDARYGVGVKMICVGTQASTSKAAIELAEKYPNDVWATAGFHPNHLSEEWYHDRKEQKEAEPEEFDIGKLRNLAKHSKVVAIGECGLDYYRLSANREAQIVGQKEIFVKQLELAKELNKPLMIHCRPSKGTDDAYFDIFEILKNNSLLSRVIAVMHFFAGGVEMAKSFIDAGFYFTFGGVITFARDYDEVIKYIPLDRILMETDAPYVAPEPYRGRRNEPAYIIEAVKKLAEIKNLSYEKIVEKTYNNSLQIFKIAL